MSDTPLVPIEIDLDAEIDALARRYRSADNIGMQLLNMVNKPADGLLERLPKIARERLETLTIRGLEAGMSAASGSRVLVKDKSDWVNTATTTAAGIVGGFGGLPTALAELPITVTLLMRAVQGIASEHGYDADDMQTRRDTLLVFASTGPLTDEDGLDMNFLASRATLNGVNVYVGIGLIAPKLAAVLGRKLATQTIPVLGAGVAAATNFTYTSYYQHMAHVVFGLRRLSDQSGKPYDELVAMLREQALISVSLSKSA